MATKLAKAAMAGAGQHTAGIYADMTVDGPEIGTLVVVVDRARHLPNRKTMGKQDPYCAVRLAKEAKKTETDRRGGQTPKWDQELRFPVFDSPDYQKLKVSLFNDDKKCDLIGETWIDLEEILEPGGGQRDKWFTLHYKARYAGEVQLELTFWDSRPKQEKAEPPRRAVREGSTEAVSGPRAPGKRRPLPQEPGASGPSPHRSATEQPPAAPTQRGPRELPPPVSQSAPPAPQQQTRPPPQQHPYDEPPPPAPVQGYHNEPTYDSHDMRSYSTSHHELEQDRFEPQPPHHALPEPPHAMVAPPESHYGGMELPELPPHTPRYVRNSAPHTPKHYSPLDRSPAQYVLPQYGSPEHFHRAESLPAPPVHNGQRYTEDLRALPEPQENYGPVPDRRIAHSHSYQDFSHPEDFRAPSPAATQLSGHSAPFMDEQLYHDPSGRRASDVEAYGYGTPAHRFEHPPHRHSMMEPADHRHEIRAGPYGMPSYATPPRREMPGAQYGAFGDPDMGHHDELRDDAPMHRSSVPVIRPQARAPERVSPIARRSIPPYESTPTGSDGGLGGVAFSPDSFDVLNPNLHLVGENVNLPGPKYNSPQGIREAARDRQKEIDLESNGPIVDAAGRIVDPTDHLPSDTWAPEPVKKSHRKTHEVKIKFRHHQPAASGIHSLPGSSPLGYRESSPMAPRPHSLQTSPVPMPSPNNPTSLTFDPSPTRSRLQKKFTRGAYQPSSPATAYQSSSPGYQRTHTTPLREMPNYGSGSSPMDAERMREVYGIHAVPNGYGAGPPPPIPAKIPLGRGQEEYAPSPMGMGMGMGMGGLEAEIGRIDIGSVGGAGRWRGGYRDI